MQEAGFSEHFQHCVVGGRLWVEGLVGLTMKFIGYSTADGKGGRAERRDRRAGVASAVRDTLAHSGSTATAGGNEDARGATSAAPGADREADREVRVQRR